MNTKAIGKKMLDTTQNNMAFMLTIAHTIEEE